MSPAAGKRAVKASAMVTVAGLAGTMLVSGVLPTIASAAVGDEITGSIWQDYDSNGMFDTYESGLAGIEVKAYDGAGNVAGPVTTAADGTYALPVTSDAARWRVEANVPSTPQWEQWRDSVVGRAGGAANGTTVQVADVSAGGAADVDFSFQVPNAYVENNPYVYLPEYRYGANDGPQGALSGGTVIEYDAVNTPGDGGIAYTPVPQTVQVPFNQLGATNGSTWQRAEEPGDVGEMFTAAYVRRHSALGPGGIGAIYRVTPDDGTLTSPTGTASVFADVTDYGIDVGPEYDAGATATANGIRPRATADNPAYDWARDAQAWDKVGRTGLGGLSFSADENYMFAVNLYNRSLIRIETGKPAGSAPAAVQEFELDSYFPDSGDLRPFGVSTDPLTNTMYLTVTDTAESTKNNADLHGYVYSFDPQNPTALTLVLDFPLNFPRTDVRAADPVWRDGEYQFWTTDSADMIEPNTRVTPLVADAKVLHGDLIVGVRDLQGDLLGSQTYLAPGDDRQASIRSGGDVYKATGNADGTFTMESNGVAGGVTGAGATAGPVGPPGGEQAGLQGPGGWKFFDDSWAAGLNQFQYTGQALGSIITVPSRDDGILTTGIHVGGGSQQVGVRRLYQETGAYFEPRGAVVIQNTPVAGVPNVTAKGNGLGSMAALASAAPIEIGNYVWFDPDNDGVQDPDEESVPGATVNLYEVAGDGSRTLVSTTLTDAKGEYYFSSNDAAYALQTNTDYVVGIDNPADYAPGGVLENWYPTVPDTGDSASVDADRNDSDGIVETSEAGSFPFADITTGGPGENDHSIDFGFVNIDYEFTKSTLSGPTPSANDDGTWTITYQLTAENTGMVDGSYELSDDLTGYGEGIEVVDTEVVSGPDGAALNTAWDGLDDQRVITESMPIDAQSTIGNSTQHVYTLEVTVRLVKDATTGEVLPSAEDLACTDGQAPGDEATTGLFNVATMDPSNHEDLVDDECGELPKVSLDKTIEVAPHVVDRENLPGVWEITYGLAVTNETAVATDYDLEDQLRFGTGVDIVEDSVAVVNTDPGTIETSGSYNGIDDVVIVTDEPIAANATHTYTVTVRFTLDLPGAATQPDPSDCSLIEGSEDGTGLFNDASSSFNGYESADDECAEVGQVTHEKSIISATPIGEGQWEVVYGIEVRNKGVASTLYDLDDELHFTDQVSVVSTEVTSVPVGVTSVAGWDGSTQLQVAEGVTIGGTDDEGYAPHEYVLTVVADVPLNLGEPVDGVDPAACGVSDAVDSTDRALNNVSTLTDEAGVDEDDDACAELPSIDIAKTISAGPVANGDGTWAITYDVVASNTGAVDGEYTVTDQLRYGAGIVVESADVVATPDGVTALDTWTGQGPEGDAANVIAADVVLPAEGEHTYQVQVLVSLDTETVTPESLLCPEPGSGEAGGLANTTGIEHNDLTGTDEACASLPDIDVVKDVTVEPAPVEGEPGVYEVTYSLTVTNSGLGAGEYDLDDALRLGDGVTVEGAPVVTTDAPESVGLNEAYDGAADVRVVTGQPIAAAADDATPTVHTYTVVVWYSVDLASTGEAGVGVSNCAVDEGEEGTGLSNTTGVSWNGYTGEDQECREVGEPALDKVLVSADPIGNGQWEVVYDLTVTNLGAGATSYDLDDVLRFDPTITVDSAAVDAAPEGVVTAGDWDGAAQTRIATDVPLLGVDDEGYAPHVYAVRVVANVPLSFEESDIEGAGPACTVPGGDNQLEQGLNNVATVTTDASEEITDTDCAGLPDIAVDKTITAGPARVGDEYTTTYEIDVTNSGAVEGTYVLRDQLRYGNGIEVVEVSATNVAPGDVAVLDTFTGTGDAVGDAENAITGDVVLPAGQTDTYEVVVVSTLDADAATAESTRCLDEPGATDASGLLNTAIVEHNGLQAESDACAPLVPPPGVDLPRTGATIGPIALTAGILVFLGVLALVLVQQQRRRRMMAL